MNSGTSAFPRIAVQCFGRDLALGVAQVTEVPAAHPALAATWLSGSEHDRAARFAVAHARADFLAGRIAAKSAARALVPTAPAPAAWAIVPGIHHQPRLPSPFSGYGVSLTHAGGWGVAVVHREPLRCGVDLEPADRDASDVIVTQVTPAEADWARAGVDRQRERWLLLWTAREALGKSYGTGLLEPERLVATEAWTPVANGWRARFADGESNLVRSVLTGGFVITLVLPAELDADAVATWLSGALT